MSYTVLWACALKPDDMECIGKRGGRTYSIPNSIWKYYAQLTSFSLQCSITWLHEGQFCSAIWAVKLGLERAGLYAQLCHKQAHIAAVTPAPAVSRICQEEGFFQQPELSLAKEITCAGISKWSHFWDCCSGTFSWQRGRFGNKIRKFIYPVAVLGWEQKATMK